MWWPTWRSEEHTSELQSRQYLNPFPTRRSSDLEKKLLWNVDEGLTGLKLSFAINAKGGETVVGQGKKITPTLFKAIQAAKISQAEVASNDLEGAYVVADVEIGRAHV